MSPRVSVVMSVFNGQRYLRQSIESILNQSFGDLELVIVDDGSTDDTPRILEGYARQDNRVLLQRQDENLGVTYSLNNGFQLASGEYLARQDADDLSLENRLFAQVDFLDNRLDIGTVGTWVAYIDDGSLRTGLWRTPESSALVHWSLLFGTALAHPTVMMRRDLFRDGEVYDSDIRYAQDYDLWSRLSSTTRLANLPQVLYLRRVHEQMVGARRGGQQEQTVRTVMKTAIEELLGEKVQERLVEKLRPAGSSVVSGKEDLQAVVDIVVRLYSTFVAQNLMSDRDARAIAEDAANRLAKIAIGHANYWPVDSGRVLWRAMRLSPRIIATRYPYAFLRGLGRNIASGVHRIGS